MASPEPPTDFSSADLDIVTLPAGQVWGRVYLSRFPDPLGFGKSGSRFSDPRQRVERNRFGVFYLGRTLKVCFLEAVLRDGHDAIVGELVKSKR